MRNNPVDLGEVKILVSGTMSGELERGMQYMRGFVVFAPPTLTGTCYLQVSADKGTSWQYLYSGGVKIQVFAASAIAVDFVCWDMLRVLSDTAELAERVFVIKGVEEVR